MQVICLPFYSLNRAVGGFEIRGGGIICYQVLIGLNDLPKSGGVGVAIAPCPPVPTALLKDNLTTFLGDHKVMHTSLPIHRSANI